MLRRIAFLVAALIATPAAAQQIVTSPVELIDNSPTTPGIIVVSAKTTPQVKPKTVIFPCAGGGNPWRYSVGVPCPAPEPTIAPPNITTAAKDYGASAVCMSPPPGVSGNFHAIRAMDCVVLRVEKPKVWDQVPRTVQDFRIDASREGVTTQPKSNKTSSYTPINNITLERFEMAARKRGVFIRNGSSNWLIRDFKITGIGINTNPGDIPGGIVLDNAQGITIERGEVSGFKTELTSGYDNADCIAAERTDSLIVRDVYVHDCTDGGIDTKANTRLYNVTAENIGHYSLRAWAYGEASTFTSINPHGAHIQIASKTADWHIAKLVAVGGKALVHVDSKGIGGSIDITECDLSKWTGTATMSGFFARANVKLGPTCKR